MSKFYTVIRGKKPRVYETWKECQKQTNGFSGALFKSYPSREQAEAAYAAQSIEESASPVTPVVNTPDYDAKSISVDASCLGNPGVMEYQGVITGTGQYLFDSKVYPKGTNNIGEFLALVDAIKYLVYNNYDYPIYTDSETAMSWVRNKRVRTSLELSQETAELLEDIDDAIDFLTNSNYQPDIRKWETKLWGESKADFGRK